MLNSVSEDEGGDEDRACHRRRSNDRRLGREEGRRIAVGDEDVSKRQQVQRLDRHAEVLEHERHGSDPARPRLRLSVADDGPEVAPVETGACQHCEVRRH